MNHPYGYTPTPPRSAIPKVIGILMIVMCGLGLVLGLAGQAMGPDKQFAHLEAWRKLDEMSKLLGLFGLPISILGLVTGIFAVKYKAIAPKLAVVYGGLGIIQTVVAAFVTYTYTKRALDAALGDLGGHIDDAMQMGMNLGMVLGLIIGVAWSLVVLILMNRPAAKAACVN